jgi:hypothetical protein
MSTLPNLVASQIRQMTIRERAELLRLLRAQGPDDEPTGSSGVREPRNPLPSRPNISAALELPADDEELAQQIEFL